MALLDPTSDLGRVRLRIGDWHDLVILPDAVIQATLDDNNGSVTRAVQRCAMYILATLTSRTHKKVGPIEIFGSDQFDNYVQFITKMVLNPALSDVCPIPYVNPDAIKENPLVQVADDWKAGYYPGAVVLTPGTFAPVYPPLIIAHEPT